MMCRGALCSAMPNNEEERAGSGRKTRRRGATRNAVLIAAMRGRMYRRCGRHCWFQITAQALLATIIKHVLTSRCLITFTNITFLKRFYHFAFALLPCFYMSVCLSTPLPNCSVFALLKCSAELTQRRCTLCET